MKLGKKLEYYSIKPMLKHYPDAQYYMVIGERSNGKTYSTLEYSIEQFYNNGGQFAYIRRWGEDVRRKHMNNLFSNLIEKGKIEKLTKGEYNTIKFDVGEFFIGNKDENGNVTYLETPIGFSFDLNSVEHTKSTGYPRVTTIIFDEFMSRKGYLPNEFILFSNLLSTIIRERNNVKIFMLGNTVNKYCPYFREMGLKHVFDQKQGTIDAYHYSDSALQVIVEYCNVMNEKEGKPSDIYFSFDNPQLQMITKGSWEIAIYPHLDFKYRPKDIITQFFIEFENNILHCEVIADNKGIYMFVHPKTSEIKNVENDIVYSNVPSQRWNYRTGIMRFDDKLSKLILKLIHENKVFYSDNETGEVLRNFIMWSNSFSSVRGGS